MKKNQFKHLALIISLLFLGGKINAQQWDGYTLYATMNGTTAYLIDTNSTVYHSWTFPGTAQTGYSSHLLPGGVLLRSVKMSGVSFNGGPICGKVQKVDWNGNVIWDYVYSTTQYCTHHDVLGMPNGNVMVIAYERRTAAEATQAGSTSAIEMWPDKIVEIQPTGATTGTVVWEWKIWDHLVQNVDPTKDNYQTSIIDHPELMNINYQTQKDWIHMNGIDYNPITDQVVFSSHNMDEWYVIDHSTTTAEAATHSGGNSGKGGDFLYRWGNPAAYGASGTAILNVTHDAHWIPEGVPNAGYLVGYNNRGINNNQSCVDQIDPPNNGYTFNYTPGTALPPSTYLLRQAGSGLSTNMGSSQQLPNGNQLICMATLGLIYEVNPAGTTIWTKQVTGSVPQSFRYSPCYVANTPPAAPVISENAGVLTSSSGATYQWYLNGELISGANQANYTPTTSGIYLVRITDANACFFVYSTGFSYTIPSEITEQKLLTGIKIFPNPGNGFIQLEAGKLAGKNYTVQVLDALGRQILLEQNSKAIDLEFMDQGFYSIRIGNETEGYSNHHYLLQK